MRSWQPWAQDVRVVEYSIQSIPSLLLSTLDVIPLLRWSRFTNRSHYHGLGVGTDPSGLREVNIAENVDCTYAVYIGNQRAPVAIGEMKRNLINSREWQTGRLSEPQQRLARELRG